MSKTRFLVLAVGALVLLNLVTLGYLFQDKLSSKQGGPRKVIIERLGFDEKQAAAYDLLIEKHRSAIRQKETELAATRQSIYQLLKADDFSKKDSLTTLVGELQMAVEQIHFAHFQDIKGLCKPEQRASFDALADELATFFPGKKGGKKHKSQLF
jgi:periplasmic protein CpxP/Spy